MAVYYVWSGATGSANGSSWANAYTKIATAVGGSAAGDTYYLAHDHSETTAGAINIFVNGSTANPVRIICVNRAGSVPPVSADRRATGQVATTGDSGIQIAIGSVIVDGVIFVAGNSTGAPAINAQGSAPHFTRMDNCSLRLGSTGNGTISFNTAGAYVELNNTTMSFSGVGQKILLNNNFRWKNTPSALIGTAVPTTLFAPASNGMTVECIGVDLSAAGSGKTLFGTFTNADTVYKIVDCKLNASATRFGTPQTYASEANLIRTGATGNYTVACQRTAGLLTEETTIVRSGGASDGTTPIAWKAVTTATCSFSMPFECPPIAIWNDVSGSTVTATVEGIWGAGAVPNDNEAWIEVEYLGDASSPLGSFVNDGTPDLLTTPAAQTASSATWGGSTTKFKLNVSFTAQQKGLIYARVKCAKASTTFYIDPLVTLT